MTDKELCLVAEQRQALQQSDYLGQGHRLGRSIGCGEGMEGVTSKVTTTFLTGVSWFVLMGFDMVCPSVYVLLLLDNE